MPREIYYNYNEALDNKQKLPDSIIHGIDLLNSVNPYFRIPTGASNCTLNVSQWVGGPPISNSRTMLNEKWAGYNLISEEEAIPGDIVIASNPELDSNHTMLLQKQVKEPKTILFKNKSYDLDVGDWMVEYSNGSSTEDAYTNTALKAYLDNSGDKYGNNKKTELYYVRYVPNDRQEGILPTLYVTPNGNYYHSDIIRFLNRDLSEEYKQKGRHN